ncbi:MAG: flavodoxin domain-containing protein [Acidimicrobiia bacterium]
MRVLVTTASKHGSTADIGRAIADVLSDEGLEARILAPEAVSSLDGFDAVVMGSAVYAGHWMKSIRELSDRLSAELSERPVWLFSSGPIGDPPKPEEDPVDVAPVMEKTGARDHFVFAGRIDRNLLNFGERAIVSALKAPEGDFRDWDHIRDTALSIVRELKTKV